MGSCCFGCLMSMVNSYDHIRLTTLFLGRLRLDFQCGSLVLSAHTFACNLQLLFFNQQKEK